MTWLRALLAAALSLALPGAGHALLRDWFRAVVFAGLFLSATFVFMPAEQLSNATSFSEAYATVESETSRMAQFTLSFLVLFAAVDAGFRALGAPPGSGSADADVPACPECGKELDEDLTFCHWCTTELAVESEESSDDDGDGESDGESETEPEGLPNR